MTWLVRPPNSPTIGQIRLALQKRQFLTEVGIETWEPVNLHPNRQKRPSAVARSRTNQALARLADEKRYPLLIASCLETYRVLTDYVLRLFEEYGEDIVRRANRELTEHQLKQVRAKDRVVVTLGRAAQPIVDELNIAGEDLRISIYSLVPRSELVDAIELVLAITEPNPRTFHHFLATRYRTIKSFSTAMLNLP